MDKKLKAKWLRALKSGKYAKGEGQMCIKAGERDEDRNLAPVGYDRLCCLAILCEVAEVPYRATDGGTAASDPPRAVLGLSDKDASILAALNDNRPEARLDHGGIIPVAAVKRSPKDFRRVIKYIEKNL